MHLHDFQRNGNHFQQINSDCVCRDRDIRSGRDPRDPRGLERERERDRDREKDKDYRNPPMEANRDPRGRNFPSQDKDFRSRKLWMRQDVCYKMIIIQFLYIALRSLKLPQNPTWHNRKE